MIDMENLLQLLDTPGKVVDAPNATDLQLAEGAVEFRDVMFGYERGVPVLKGVSGVGNSSIHSTGSSTGIVGLLVCESVGLPFFLLAPAALLLLMQS